MATPSGPDPCCRWTTAQSGSFQGNTDAGSPLGGGPAQQPLIRPGETIAQRGRNRPTGRSRRTRPDRRRRNRRGRRGAAEPRQPVADTWTASRRRRMFGGDTEGTDPLVRRPRRRGRVGVRPNGQEPRAAPDPYQLTGGAVAAAAARASTTIAGYVSAEVARRAGLPSGTPVVSGAAISAGIHASSLSVNSSELYNG